MYRKYGMPILQEQKSVAQPSREQTFIGDILNYGHL
jgi:hypothetical protein